MTTDAIEAGDTLPKTGRGTVSDSAPLRVVVKGPRDADGAWVHAPLMAEVTS